MENGPLFLQKKLYIRKIILYLLHNNKTNTMKTYKGSTPEIYLGKKKSDLPKIHIKSSKDVESFARKFYFEDIELYESMFMILLNRRNKTIGWVKISQGGVAGTMCDIKLVAKYAIESLASSVILVHNHPSGDNKPSDTDIRLTKKVEAGLKILDIFLLDHLIITPENYTSMKDDYLF